MMLGFAGVLAAGMAIVASFGLVSACGMDFVSIVGNSPFLIIGKHIIYKTITLHLIKLVKFKPFPFISINRLLNKSTNMTVWILPY